MTNEEAVKGVMKIWTGYTTAYAEVSHEDVEAVSMAIEALSKQSASSEQADQYNEQVSYKAQVEILADVLDSCPLTEPCDLIWRPTGWCKDHCKDGQDSPDAECWLEYARVMTESKTESDHIADSDKMVDQFREDTKMTDSERVSLSEQEKSNSFPEEPPAEGNSEVNCSDEWWKNYIRSRLKQDDVPDTNVEKIPYKKPEIIYCKDFRYAKGVLNAIWCDKNGGYYNPVHHFCSMAERETNDSD